MSDIPTGWEIKNLGQVTNLIMGQSPSSDTYNTERNGLPFFQGKADFGTHYPKIRTWCSEPTKIAPENSILFSVRAPVGDVNITKTECCIGRGLASMQGKSVNQEYLYQQIQFVKPQFQVIAQGSTFEAVNGSEIKSFPILVPPLPEQQKIASILTSVDDVIDKTQSQINKLQDLKKGTMNELLTRGIGHTEFVDSPVGKIPKGWEVKAIQQIATRVTDGEHQTPKRSESGYFLLSARNIRDGYISLTDVDYVPKDEFEKLSRRISPLEGDVLISCSGSVGRSSVVPPNLKFAMVRSVAIVQPNRELIRPHFLQSVIEAELVQNQIKRELSQLAQANLFQANIKSLKVPVPTLEEQDRIVSIVQSIHQSIDNKFKKLEQTKSLKKSLMQDLLTGNVRVPLQ